LARIAQCRVPHRLLPSLLDAAAAKKELRPVVSAVVDERGRWLMQFNSRWKFASSSSVAVEDVWLEGNRQQRSEILRSVRDQEPAKARVLVESSWKDDAADERAEWVGQMLVGLDATDEPFLESCLDDRSSKVREAAADLLARLPESAFVQRMVQRTA